MATDISSGFIFGTFQKFYGLLKSNSFLLEILKRKLRILIIDEAHKSTALSYSKVINDLMENINAQFIGLTATPGRATQDRKENLKLANFFNKKLISPRFNKNPILELRKKGILSRLKRRILYTKIDIELRMEDEVYNDLNYDFSISTLNKLASNLKRNKLILNCIRDEVRKKNPCLIFSCTVEHSNILAAALNYEGIKALSIDSRMNKALRKKIIDEF